jgi:hypothetical protein
LLGRGSLAASPVGTLMGGVGRRLPLLPTSPAERSTKSKVLADQGRCAARSRSVERHRFAGEGAGNHAAVLGRADGRKLRRQGARRRGHEVDRPSRIRLRGRVERTVLRHGLRRRHPFPQARADRQHGRGERQTHPHGQDEPACRGGGKRGRPPRKACTPRPRSASSSSRHSTKGRPSRWLVGSRNRSKTLH